MLSQDKKKPLGKMLQNAGLISNQQLQNALRIKTEYPQMKLGEILVLQEAVKTQTVDFFVDKWEQIEEEGQQLPIGNYLQSAGLLNKEQVETILSEQKANTQKFGNIAIDKGWLKKDTIDFFVSHLSVKLPHFISLSDLEQYNRDVSHLEYKYTNHDLILTRILAWVGGNYTLAKAIINVFAEYDFKIDPGSETIAVDKFIENNLIRKWQSAESAKHIRYIQYRLINNQNFSPIKLLKEYRDVLLLGIKRYEQTGEQNELLILGLIIEQQNQLRISNLIYQQIFSQDWLAAQIAKLEVQEKIQAKRVAESATKSRSPQIQENPIVIEDAERFSFSANINNYSQSNSNSTTEAGERVPPDLLKDENDSNIDDKNSSNQTLESDSVFDNSIVKNKETNAIAENGKSIGLNALENDKKSNTLEPVTKLSSLIILLGIILFIPFVLAVNNYNSSSRTSSKLGYQVLSETERLQKFCQYMNITEPGNSLGLIAQLEQSEQQLTNDSPKGSEPFPNNCKIALNKLRVLTALQLGKENRVIEAIKNLCKVPADSESFNEAIVWIDRWYNSPDWAQETRSYLNLVNECPANDQK